MKQKETRPWVDEARSVREMIAQAPRGMRESELRQIAQPRSSQTLRRAIAAVEFLDKLAYETTFPTRELEIFPVATIEYLARWYKRDHGGALDAGDKLLRGEITPKTIGEKERESRKKVFDESGKALEGDYRRSITSEIENIARSFGRGVLSKGSDFKLYGQDVGRVVDFVFSDESKSPLVAFVIAGPYRDADLYIRRAFDWISKANALLNIFKLVYLILPENSNFAYFDELQHNLKINPERLRIITPLLPQK